jgi:hypothetical protein
VSSCFHQNKSAARLVAKNRIHWSAPRINGYIPNSTDISHRFFVEAGLGVADLLGKITHVDDTFGIELRPIA